MTLDREMALVALAREGFNQDDAEASLSHWERVQRILESEGLVS